MRHDLIAACGVVNRGVHQPRYRLETSCNGHDHRVCVCAPGLTRRVLGEIMICPDARYGAPGKDG